MTGADGAEDSRPRPWIRLDRDLVVALASLVVAVSAVVVSVSQTRLMRRQAEASVWPRLVLGVSQTADSVHVTVRNAGVGPAQLRWAQLLWRGTPLSSVRALMDSLPTRTGETFTGRNFGIGTMTGAVFTPAEEKVLFYIAGSIVGPLTAAAAETALRMCYCSVYDQCWQFEMRGLRPVPGSRDVAPVNACGLPQGPTI
jgi:hypothetical protein